MLDASILRTKVQVFLFPHFFYPDDEGRKILQEVSIYFPEYAASHFRRIVFLNK
jgi:hypothetical protein